MKRYRVDLSSLDFDARAAAFEALSGTAFLVSRVYSGGKLDALEIFWDLPIDLEKHPAFPAGCSYREIKD